MYTRMCAHTYIHTCAHTHTHTHAHTHEHARTHTHTRAHTSTRTCTNLTSGIGCYTLCVHTRTQTAMYTHAHTTHIHAHIHLYTAHTPIFIIIHVSCAIEITFGNQEEIFNEHIFPAYRFCEVVPSTKMFIIEKDLRNRRFLCSLLHVSPQVREGVQIDVMVRDFQLL